ncbi:hypothetical protein [Mucilaginibacter frigoritolerans]|uniref:hypothetical protein n=1 Tax=Mucilaginibacter frigoritolerans TaxID=652788 RepID=UPI001476E313|nr:hypothetical protein [Mucilaginibacter frigoritolerans]
MDKSQIPPQFPQFKQLAILSSGGQRQFLCLLFLPEIFLYLAIAWNWGSKAFL